MCDSVQLNRKCIKQSGHQPPHAAEYSIEDGALSWVSGLIPGVDIPIEKCRHLMILHYYGFDMDRVRKIQAG